MTSSTSRRSAKATPKPVPVEEPNGIQLEKTEPESEPTSGESTTWVIRQPGRIQTVKVPGRGRFTLGGTHGNHELRIYANKSDKDYVMAAREGMTVARDDVEIEEIAGSSLKASITAPAAVYELTKHDITELAESIVRNAGIEKEDEPAW